MEAISIQSLTVCVQQSRRKDQLESFVYLIFSMFVTMCMIHSLISKTDKNTQLLVWSFQQHCGLEQVKMNDTSMDQSMEAIGRLSLRVCVKQALQKDQPESYAPHQHNITDRSILRQFVMNCNVDQNDTKVSMSLEIVLHPSLQAQSSLIMNSDEQEIFQGESNPEGIRNTHLFTPPKDRSTMKAVTLSFVSPDELVTGVCKSMKTSEDLTSLYLFTLCS